MLGRAAHGLQGLAENWQRKVKLPNPVGEGLQEYLISLAKPDCDQALPYFDVTNTLQAWRAMLIPKTSLGCGTGGFEVTVVDLHCNAADAWVAMRHATKAAAIVVVNWFIVTPRCKR